MERTKKLWANLEGARIREINPCSSRYLFWIGSLGYGIRVYLETDSIFIKLGLSLQ